MAQTARSQFILASASPRRKRLLAQAGYRFDVVVCDIDEAGFSAEGLDSVEHAKRLALAKAGNVAAKYPGKLVLGADTVVDLDGKTIGKPRDSQHAERITRMLFSKPHKVITGIAFVKLDEQIEIVESETTIVYPKKLSEQQIVEHVTNGDWRGKAGAYGIQETGDEFVEKIEGSFTNVIGLPIELTEQILQRLLTSQINHRSV